MGHGIRDVARVAGVSPATVSRVLNDKTSGVQISAATIERVRSAAAALRYQPNAAARSLRTTRAQTIGVIARNLLHPFIAELLRVIYTECQARGFHLLVGNAEHSSSEGWVLGDILSADRVDGVLLIGDILPNNRSAEDIQRFIQSHGHVVTVSGRPSMAGECAVMVDNRRGVVLALEHLVALGHRSIGYVRPCHGPESWEDQQRHAAYLDFLTEYGLPWDAAAELVVTSELEEVRAALLSLFALPTRPSAVLVNNDWTALVAMKAALTCGIRVPDDLSIVGFDDIPFAAICTPGLTTVRQPIEAIGHYAANALLNAIAGVEQAEAPTEGVSDRNTLVFPPTLVRRESARAHPIETSPTGG